MHKAKFIENMILPIPEEYEKLKTSITSTYGESFESVTLNEDESAQINGGSICVFDNSLTDQNKSDVSHSILLAQLASNKKANRYTQPTVWYKFYLETLENIGWSQSDFYSNKYENTTINWEDIVLEIMATESTKNESALAKTGMEAWQYLPIDGKGMIIWNANTVQKNNQNFQIIAVDKSDNSDVVMVIGCIQSQSLESNPDGFLSWKTKYSITRGASKYVLNESVYSPIRQQIIDKLGDRINSFIANLPLGNS